MEWKLPLFRRLSPLLLEKRFAEDSLKSFGAILCVSDILAESQLFLPKI